MKMILLTFFLMFTGLMGYAQMELRTNLSLLGVRGGVNSPDARFGKDKELHLSLGYMPERFAILTDKTAPASEYLLHANMMFLPFLEVSAHIIRPSNIDKHFYGIGDRSYKVRFRLLKEGISWPSIVLGIHDPISTNTRQGAVYIVGSKYFPINSKLFLDLSTGYALDIRQPFWEKIGLFGESGDEIETQLEGFFASTKLCYKSHSLILEYDGMKYNAGYSLSILDSIWFGVYTLGLQKISCQIGCSYIFGTPLFNNNKNAYP